MAKFAELPFCEVRCIRAKRRAGATIPGPFNSACTGS
jgi:hypothetical protein